MKKYALLTLQITALLAVMFILTHCVLAPREWVWHISN
jgi:hypothetical protein